MIFGVDVGDLILGILPMVLLIAAWWFFMRKFSAARSPFYSLQERQVAALERIAAALERRG